MGPGLPVSVLYMLQREREEEEEERGVGPRLWLGWYSFSIWNTINLIPFLQIKVCPWCASCVSRPDSLPKPCNCCDRTAELKCLIKLMHHHLTH